MAQLYAGGTSNDWTMGTKLSGTDTLVTLEPGSTVATWDAATGGSPMTVTLDGVPVTSLTSDASGTLPRVLLPDGALGVWIDGGAGRVFLPAQGQPGAQGAPGIQGPPGPGTGAGAWQPATAYTANQVVQAPDGSIIRRNTSGTSGATFDVTEQAAWTALEATTDTMAGVALAGGFVALPGSALADYAVATRLTGQPHGVAWTTKEELIARALGWIVATDARIGFKGDGTTANTAALTALVAALTATGAPRTVYWPAGVYLMDGPINVASVRHIGPGVPNGNPLIGAAGPDTTTGAWLKYTSGSLIDGPSVSGQLLSSVTFEHMGLWAAPGAGHIIELGMSSTASAGLVHSTFTRCYFELGSTTSSAVHSTGSGGTYTRNLFDVEFNGCTFIRQAAHLVPAVDLVGGFGYNNIRFLGGIWNNRGCASTPFFKASAGVSGSSVGPFIFRNITGSSNAGGLIQVDNPKGVVVDSVVDWDLGGRNLTTLSGALTIAGGAITSLPVNALPNAFNSGNVIRLASGANTQTWTLTAAAAVGATTVSVTSQVPNFDYPTGTNVQSAYQQPLVRLTGNAGSPPVGCWVDGVGTVDPGGSLFAAGAGHIRIENGFNNAIGGRIYNGFSGTTPIAPVLIIGTGCDRPVTKYKQSATLDFPSIAAGGTASLTVTVTGVVAGDHVIAVPNSLSEAGLVFVAAVTANDTVTVRANNVTAGAIDPAARTWNVTVLHY